MSKMKTMHTTILHCGEQCSDTVHVYIDVRLWGGVLTYAYPLQMVYHRVCKLIPPGVRHVTEHV